MKARSPCLRFPFILPPSSFILPVTRSRFCFSAPASAGASAERSQDRHDDGAEDGLCDVFYTLPGAVRPPKLRREDPVPDCLVDVFSQQAPPGEGEERGGGVEAEPDEAGVHVENDLLHLVPRR